MALTVEEIDRPGEEGRFVFVTHDGPGFKWDSDVKLAIGRHASDCGRVFFEVIDEEDDSLILCFHPDEALEIASLLARYACEVMDEEAKG